MGYLIAGRIGTGKTFLVQCWAGELGIPCVVFKNFRDRWVGATESNLEKIFAVLRALGQVVVFVDEADQAAGKREGGDGDSGLSGRVYSMLAKEMSDTRNRGRIIWVFATSRPDLLEVDLKRQGRLDVHIPLFPPETPEERRGAAAGDRAEAQVPARGRRPAGARRRRRARRATSSRASWCGRCAVHELAPSSEAATQGRAGGGAAGSAAEPAHAEARVHGPGGREGVHRRAVSAGAVPDLTPEELEDADRRAAAVRVVGRRAQSRVSTDSPSRCQRTSQVALASRLGDLSTSTLTPRRHRPCLPASAACFAGSSSLFISGLEEANPEALMEAARQEFRKKMTQYNMALAKMAGVAERLKSQVKARRRKAQDLERRILANHRAGNMELAGTLARELQELKADLTHRHAGAAGDRGGLPGQPAAGQSRAAGLRGQDPPAGEAAVAGARSRKRRPKPPRRCRASPSRSAISATP